MLGVGHAAEEERLRLVRKDQRHPAGTLTAKSSVALVCRVVGEEPVVQLAQEAPVALIFVTGRRPQPVADVVREVAGVERGLVGKLLEESTLAANRVGEPESIIGLGQLLRHNVAEG